MKYRRSRTLILYWHDGELTVENYLEPRSSDVEVENAIGVDPMAVELLNRFDDWTDTDTVVSSFSEYSPKSVMDAIETLVDHRLLLSSDESVDEERFLDAWKDWSEEARFFHFATKNAVYTGDSEEQRRADARRIRETGGPPPPIFKTYPNAPRIYLPRAFVPLNDSFGDVLTHRRTHRRFTDQPIDIRSFSTALFYTFGPMVLYTDSDLGTMMMRTSPSAGARHELEGYVGVLNVDRVQPGLYHYCAENHSLELLSSEFDRVALSRFTYESEMCTPSAFVCFVTAVFTRTMWKYPHPRTYRATLLGAGHLGQTFVLTCTALGLGGWQSAAFRDDELEQALGVDGYREGALYMFGAGHPAVPGGLPADVSIGEAIHPAQLIAGHHAPL